MLHLKNIKGQVLVDDLENPACFFDKETFTLMKIGERELVKELYNYHRAAYLKGGYNKQADSLVMVDLPKDQDIIDKVFNISGYCKNFVN